MMVLSSFKLAILPVFTSCHTLASRVLVCASIGVELQVVAALLPDAARSGRLQTEVWRSMLRMTCSLDAGQSMNCASDHN